MSVPLSKTESHYVCTPSWILLWSQAVLEPTILQPPHPTAQAGTTAMSHQAQLSKTCLGLPCLMGSMVLSFLCILFFLRLGLLHRAYPVPPAPMRTLTIGLHPGRGLSQLDPAAPAWKMAGLRWYFGI